MQRRRSWDMPRRDVEEPVEGRKALDLAGQMAHARLRGVGMARQRGEVTASARVELVLLVVAFGGWPPG